MDDSIVPLSAQYSYGADVIYYGEHSHSDFGVSIEVADFMADQILRYLFGGHIECSVFAEILRYLFGGYIECSVFAGSGTFEHKADWLPGTDSWEDVVGEVLANSGSLWHKNESYIKWQEWEDLVGECPLEGKRSSYQVSRASFPILTSIQESHWLSPDDPADCRLYIRTRTAPRSSVQVDWGIYRRGLLPLGVKRDHYEVEVIDGTPLTGITRVSWVTDDPRDLRMRAWSQADSPFRWFKAEWRAYSKEIRQMMVIDEIS